MSCEVTSVPGSSESGSIFTQKRRWRPSTMVSANFFQKEVRSPLLKQIVDFDSEKRTETECMTVLKSISYLYLLGSRDFLCSPLWF